MGLVLRYVIFTTPLGLPLLCNTACLILPDFHFQPALKRVASLSPFPQKVVELISLADPIRHLVSFRPIRLLEFPLMLMGVLASWSVHTRPSTQQPIDTSRNFSVDMSGGRANLNFLIKVFSISGDSKHFYVYKKQKERPEFFFLGLNSNIFVS